MKFKKVTDAALYDRPIRQLIVKDKSGDTLEVETRDDGKPGLWLFIVGQNVELSRSKALKLAWAIIDELQPSGL